MPAVKIKTRTCRGCGKVETGISRSLVTDFCSKECWRVNMAGKYLRRGKEYECAYCGNSFYRRPGQLRGVIQQFCSMPCRIAFKDTSVLVKCPTCQTEFRQDFKRNTYCSTRCSKLGSLNPNWKTDKYPRRVGFSRVWRNAVFQRDNYTCQACGERGGKLHPHHKDGFHWAVERRNDVTNGVTLCVRCHSAFHTMYGKHNNTEAQFNEWIEAKDLGVGQEKPQAA